jgi:predicted transcriptional regulator
MSEEAKKNLEAIGEKLNNLPEEVASAALDQFAARMEGFADGFIAGKAHAEKTEK